MTRVGLAAASLVLALTLAQTSAQQQMPRLALELEDYAALPVTADNTNDNTRAQLARVNYLRDEPGGRRFFVNDLNGPLYILDKQTKTFTTYLNFNGAGGRPGLFPKFTFERNFATGLTNFIFDPAYQRTARSTRCTWKTRPSRRLRFQRLAWSLVWISPDTRPRPRCRRQPSMGRSTAKWCSSNGAIGTSRTRRSRARRGSSCKSSTRSHRIRWVR